MIACIRGELVFKSAEKLIVMAGGVGYEVFATAGCLKALPETGHQALVHVHTHVREDAMLLYGFADEEEKRIFHLLLGVSGIGPKLALAILSGISPGELAAAVRNESLGRLTQLSGVGKKTAERLCLELKDKLQWVPEQHGSHLAAMTDQRDQLWLDTVSVLVNLGYPPNNAEDAVRKAMAGGAASEGLSLEELVKQSLRLLA
ncbi:MAG: Holliday junction branch migration protein RuvA [Deltaproteobacteria bacterium]|nr:Holliday junction branch migration protein RuvA [Deltaproteobacteria bacterium]